MEKGLRIMKVSSIFKYIFIIFAVGIIAYAGYRIYNNQNKEEENNQDSTTVVEENIIRDLRMGITNYDTMNPLITQNKDIINIDTLIYEPLFNLTKDYQLEPCLAKECSKTGDKIYVVKTVSNAVWHDNTPFIAKDIAFTIEALKNKKTLYSKNVENIIKTEIIDKSTIKIYLDEPVAFFKYMLNFPILASHAYNKQTLEAITKVPIGTGNYKIIQIAENEIKLEKANSEFQSKITDINIKIYKSIKEVYSKFSKKEILLDKMQDFQQIPKENLAFFTSA